MYKVCSKFFLQLIRYNIEEVFPSFSKPLFFSESSQTLPPWLSPLPILKYHDFGTPSRFLSGRYVHFLKVVFLFTFLYYIT